MRLPESIRVVHRVFSIEPLSQQESKNAWADGFCDTNNDLIRVNQELSEARQLEVLLHEIAHAIHAVADLDDDSKEEDFATRATPIWLSVWQDNPELVDLLLDSCEPIDP